MIGTDPGYIDFMVYPALASIFVACIIWLVRWARRREQHEGDKMTMIREVHEAVMGRAPDEGKRDPGVPSMGHELAEVKGRVAGIECTLTDSIERYDTIIKASHVDRDDFRATLDDHEVRITRVENEVIPK